jgi:hypothetical protein
MESLYNKYHIFKEMPQTQEGWDVVVDKKQGIPISGGMVWLLKLFRVFNNLIEDDKNNTLNDYLQDAFLSLSIQPIEQAHTFRIVNSSIQKLLLRTDNKGEYQPTPYPVIFIDEEIEIEEGLKTYGIFVEDKKTYLYIYGMLKLDNKTLFPYFTSYPYGVCQANTLNKNINKNNEGIFIIDKPIINFVQGFLNFINHPDIEIKHTPFTIQEQQKQIKRNKLPKQSENIIHLTGKLKQYVERVERKIESGEISWIHSHWVRGHFVRLQSDRYKQKRVIWRIPHIRGNVGKARNKTYEIT